MRGWLNSYSSSIEDDDYLFDEIEVDEDYGDILKKKHPCNTCGSDDGRSDQTVYKVEPAHLPAQQPMVKSDVSSPGIAALNNKSCHESALSKQSYQQLQSQTQTLQEKAVPVDFTAYFRCPTIDMVNSNNAPLSEHFRAPPMQHETLSSEHEKPSSDPFQNYYVPGSNSDSSSPSAWLMGVTSPIAPFDPTISTPAEDLEDSITRYEAYELIRKYVSRQINVVEFSVLLWSRFIRKNNGSSGGGIPF